MCVVVSFPFRTNKRLPLQVDLTSPSNAGDLDLYFPRSRPVVKIKHDNLLPGAQHHAAAAQGYDK
jgi:hypothetical protein